ncbi:23372_t:CDS:2, partial [Cetraspora pellucida]
MSQIRSELLHSQNITTIDKSLKIYKQNIATPFEQISHDNDSKVEFIFSDEDIDNNYINMEDVGNSNHIETVESSLNESENLDNLYDEDEVMYQDYLLHLANNLKAKWKLTDIFVDLLVQPDSIHLLL